MTRYYDLEAEEDPIGPDVHQVANQVESARWLLDELGARGLSGVFLRGAVPMYTSAIGEDGYIPPPPSPEGTPTHKQNDNGPATMRPVTVGSLRARLMLNYLVWRWSDGKVPTRRECFFPPDAVAVALEAPDAALNMRVLHGVTHTPMVRADGTILAEPGYDPGSGFLYLPTIDVPPVSANPTADELAAATALIRGLVDDFKWAGKHDEANYLGMLLTPLLRLVCPPPYKLGAIMARQPGSGKSLLNRVLRLVHGGVFRSEMPHDDAELEKSVSSILTQTTAPVVQFDNVSGTLRSSRLAGLLTTAEYSGRLLGSTNETQMANDRLWTVTGNNLSFGGDLVRRTLWCTIDPKVPNPELRTGFRIENLPGHVVEHRGAILHALLTWVAAWSAAGQPVPAARSSDDYFRWVQVVNGVLGVAGVPGEFDCRESMQQETGVDDEGWAELLAPIREAFDARPWTVGELVKLMDSRELSELPQRIVESLPTDLLEKWERGFGSARGGWKQSFGKWLQNRTGRYAGALKVEPAGKRNGSAVWRVVSVDDGE